MVNTKIRTKLELVGECYLKTGRLTPFSPKTIDWFGFAEIGRELRMFLRAGGMPGRRRKRCGTWSSVDIKRRRETSRIRREQETEQEKIERIKDQRERAQNTRNKTLREREQHRIMPRRGIKRNAGLTRKDATRHQVSEKTRREQERQQIRAERLRVQRERMRHISNEER